jgi:photosynthetic reaction center cytochrome c subunit
MSAADGAIAQYDEKQRSIMRGEVAGLVAGAILALGGVIALTLMLADRRAFEGYRAESQYNYAGVQRVSYTDYLASQGRKVVQPSAEAITAYNAWQAANPKTVNVNVLNKYLGDKYTDTAAVFGYMSSYFTPGVGVSCEYCHNLENFSSDEKPTKATARAMLVMQFELQNKWIETIPRPEGQVVYQLKCASCHNGQPKFWNNALIVSASDPKNFGKAAGVFGGGNPTSYDLKNIGVTLNGQTPPFYSFVDDEYLAARADADGSVNFFQVTADKDTPPGLNATYRNQNAMYHQNSALGVGCDFCHYGGYFASYVLEDGTFKWPKSQARHMQGMVQDIAINWFPQMPNLVDTAQPNCYMCHRGNVVPPGDYDDPERPAQVADPEIKPLVDLPVLKPILPEQ